MGLFPELAEKMPVRKVSSQPEATPVAESTPAPVSEPVEPEYVLRPTMVIDKPVRTGQRIYAEHANLVVLAVVNAGAELIADGNIHVYAPLRGRAIAGAHGNPEARIFISQMEAELVSIDGVFQVFDGGIPDDLRGKDVQISQDGDKLIFKKLMG